MGLPDGVPPVFGDLVRWDADDPATHKTAVVLQRGVRVSGRLDNGIERPVGPGWVEAHCVWPVPPYEAVEYRVQGGFRAWTARAAVRPDGTFEFASLPHGCDLFLLALGEGFASAEPTAEEWAAATDRYEDRAVFDPDWRHPQFVFGLDGSSEVVVRARPPGSLRVRVTTPGGSAEGLRVLQHPNVSLPGVGSAGLLSLQPTRGVLLGRPRSWPGPPNVASVGADGLARLPAVSPGEVRLSVLRAFDNVAVPLATPTEYGEALVDVAEGGVTEAELWVGDGR